MAIALLTGGRQSIVCSYGPDLAIAMHVFPCWTRSFPRECPSCCWPQAAS